MTNSKSFSLLLFCLFLYYSGFSQISMERVDEGILFTDGKKKIAFYSKEPPAMNLDKGRTNFFHPVYLPDGTMLTENAPEDHIHHRGIFWAWHQVLIDGESIADQWELKDFIHDVKSVEFIRSSPGLGTLTTIVEWKSPNYKAGASPFVEERATVDFHQQQRNYRIIQFEIELKALVDGVALGGSDDVKGYGGFSVRMKLPEDVAFSSENNVVVPQNEALEVGRLMHIYGSMAKKANRGGMLIYSANDFETANKWILRSQNSMQNAVWPGRTPVSISRVKPTVLRYAVVLYSGRFNEGRVLKALQKLPWN
ncbi:DUF6807 family protein [Sunxiuqinia sp. sy24]|uniref:DUF6807 family protein n=1 Tax=Sunxiuqinia sp. sy24 TaxID=3461495 RepID=UPI0040458BC9